MFRSFALSRTTRTRSLIYGSYPTSAPAIFLWIQTATPDMPWVERPEYTIVWPSSVVKCPCPSHLTSDNPHISIPNRIVSSPSSWTFPCCSILWIFHVPSLSFLGSCSWPCDNIVVFFIMVVTEFNKCFGKEALHAAPIRLIHIKWYNQSKMLNNISSTLTWVPTKNVCMCLNIEFILCETTTENNHLNFLTSKLHSVNDMSCSILQTLYNSHQYTLQSCVSLQNSVSCIRIFNPTAVRLLCWKPTWTLVSNNIYKQVPAAMM